MSRSYKKSPVCTDGSPHTTKEMKRIANAKIRKSYHLFKFKGKNYKKAFCSYDIHDYVSRQTPNDYKKIWNEEEQDILNNKIPKKSWRYLYHYKYKDVNDFIKHEWEKWYKRK